MRSPRIRSGRTIQSSLLSFANRFFRSFGVELAKHPSPASLDWHIKTIVEYRNVNCVLDVGANRGQFAERLRQLGYRGWILSFEPVPEAFESLSRRFRNDERWRGFPIALGNCDEIRPFHIAGGDAQASSFLDFNEAGPARWGADHTVKETVSLRVRRLDEIWDDCLESVDSPRVFLKMDCQGFDLNVVEGAARKLQHVVALQSELALEKFYEGMTAFSDAVATYEKLGFDAVGFFPLARRQPDYLRLVELDCLFMRPT
jgi:FkbM family methyltransferase